MKKNNKNNFGKKAILLIVAFALACLATYAFFLQKINTKVEAIELVQREHLPKERLERFISDIHRQGKFKLEGWNIEETAERGVFIVSYSIRWLDEGGFRTGDPVGFWFRVDPGTGLCEPLQPEATETPQKPEG